MALQKYSRMVSAIIYLCLCAGIVWQAKAVAQLLGSGGKFPHVHSYRVNVSGDVRRPGVYRVPEGTTQFEILKVAGVRPTSDLSAFNLMNAVDQSNDLNVGSRNQQVDLSLPLISARLEFFYGDVIVTAKDGRTYPTHEGMMVSEGDNIQTESSTQAEVSIGQYSRMDIDNFSDVSFDKVGAHDGERALVDLFQKTGTVWYKVVFSGKNESYRILLPAASVAPAGKGADFLVEIRPDQTSINLIDGLLLVEKNSGGESINLISGQTVTIYSDSRPFQISRLAQDLSAPERFTQLNQGKKGSSAKGQSFNFLFCGTPAVFFVASVRFDKGIVYTIHLPPRLSVEQFAQGIATLDEAFLYGGPSFVNSLVERIIGIRLSNYCILTKDNIIKTADILGGITSTIDAKAASQLRAPAGPHKFTSLELVKFLSPVAGTTPEEREARQRVILDAVFEGLRSKNIVLTTQTIQMVLAGIASNLDAAEAMDYYIRFNTSGKWTRKDIDLPVEENRISGRIVLDPVLDRCRALMESN